MIYERIKIGRFVERPNRFIAYVEIEGQREIVHVKNTGRCAELLKEGAEVYVQRAEDPNRKTKWDLIGVNKDGLLVNIDSQIPNALVEEWINAGNLFPDVDYVKREQIFGKSRFDLYVEAGERKIFIEVKGVTLESDGVVRFPDAPTERGVKHVEELCEAAKQGYEAYIFFVIQLKGARYFTPNYNTHPEFGEALKKAREKGVHILAYDCEVEADSIEIRKEVPVVLGEPELFELREPLVCWYRDNKRELPWRTDTSAYRVWVSEIMLQQTRVEAVKPFFERFLKELPTVKDLAEAEEDKLLKLWEGLGYYNRVRNMQKAAQQVMEIHQGIFPDTYEEIRNLSGIGNYTAGAISSFAYGIAKPAVDGNVLRVVSRILGSQEDIMKASVRREIEEALEEVLPKDAAGDFNQGLIELGAIVCVPNGKPKCEICPAVHLCKAYQEDLWDVIPVKSKAKPRKIEEKTVFVFQDGENIAIKKRPKKGLLAGLYELPNVKGTLSGDEAVAYSKEIGLLPIRIEELPQAKHIFSHVEWRMRGYKIRVDELSKACTEKEMLFIHPEEIEEAYPIPAAFEAYTSMIDIKLGQEKYNCE